MDTNKFIEDMIENYNDMTTSDLQACVQARCMETGEDENILLEKIYENIKNGGK